MSKDTNECEVAPGDDTNMTVTYTQIASCAVPNYTSVPMRLSLRAKLERERELRELERKDNLVNRLRNLFSPATS
jgi:hypothetical protein